MSDATKLAIKLTKAGADRAKVIEIISRFGDTVNWDYYGYHSLDSIIAEVWNSDLNSGDEPDHWIVNEILAHFGLEQVTE